MGNRTMEFVIKVKLLQGQVTSLKKFKKYIIKYIKYFYHNNEESS